jgi:hypothetical protein
MFHAMKIDMDKITCQDMRQKKIKTSRKDLLQACKQIEYEILANDS